MASSLVVDTSAVMAVLNAEREATVAIAALDSARKRNRPILMPSLVLMEVECLLLREHSPSDSDAYVSALHGWPAEVVETFGSWRREAARVKAHGNISVVDAWVAALGLITDGEVLHKDPQFEEVVGLQTIDIRRRL